MHFPQRPIGIQTRPRSIRKPIDLSVQLIFGETVRFRKTHPGCSGIHRRRRYKIRLEISITYCNHAAFNDTGFMPLTWNDGMLESWNNGQKRIIPVFGLEPLGSLYIELRIPPRRDALQG